MGRRSRTPPQLAALGQELGIYGRKVTIPARPVSLDDERGPSAPTATRERSSTPASPQVSARKPAPSIGARGDIVAYLAVVRALEGPEALRKSAAGTAHLGFGPREIREVVLVVERAWGMVAKGLEHARERSDAPRETAERPPKKPFDLSIGSETVSGLGYRLRIVGPSA